MKLPTTTVATLLEELEAADPIAAHRQKPLPTGFLPLDETIGGGVRTQELILVGGKPGVGKTVATLQWARETVLDGGTAIYACYEHTMRHLIGRLVLLELGALARAEEYGELDELRASVNDFAWGAKALEEITDERGLLKDAVACVHSYADRLWLVPSSSGSTGVDELSAAVKRYGQDRTALFVDYLQKVAMSPEPPVEEEKVTRVAEALKDLALTQDCAVVAITASNQEGLLAHRQRLHHLRGGTALGYEADVVVMLNEKTDAVSKVHLAYDATKAEKFQREVVFSIEKNRGGPAGIDMEFDKDFAYTRFNPSGRFVAERLVDERFTEA